MEQGVAAKRIDREAESKTRLPAREQLKELLKQPESSRKVQMESWAIIRSLPADQVAAAVAEARADPDAQSATMQSVMLHFRWAQLDPERALESALAEPREHSRGSMVSAALGAWMRQDPEAAFRFAQSNPALAKDAENMMARVLAKGDLKTALEKSVAISPAMREKTIGLLAAAAARSEEGRQEFLGQMTEHGSEKEREQAAQVVWSKWSVDDPAAALAAVEGMKGDRDKMMAEVFQRWNNGDPAAALVWSMDHPGALDASSRVKSYLHLNRRLPAEAAEILPQLEKEPGFLEATVKDLQSRYNKGGWEPFGPDVDGLKRTQASLRQHFQRWNELDPQAASAWRESLPADLQDNLTETAKP